MRLSATTKSLLALGFAAVVLGAPIYDLIVLPAKKASEEAKAKTTAIADPKAEAQIEAEAATAKAAGHSFENSLGLVFVPAGTDQVLFSIWDVRVKDFAAFVRATGHDAADGWKNPGWTQTEDDPVVAVSCDDARAFCQWLTAKEHAEGKLPSNQLYRLPTDKEWSTALGLTDATDRKDWATLNSDGKITEVYPWGTQWPPPNGAGNYGGEETAGKSWPDPTYTGGTRVMATSWIWIAEEQNYNFPFSTMPGYNDGYVETSPVGSFAANQFGLYDMGGNVWQWCEETVLRGASWYPYPRQFLFSSFRGAGKAYGDDYRETDAGFRCVLAPTSRP